MRYRFKRVFVLTALPSGSPHYALTELRGAKKKTKIKIF